MEAKYLKLIESFSKKLSEAKDIELYMKTNGLRGNINSHYHVWINIPAIPSDYDSGLHYDPKTPKEVADIYGYIYLEAKSEAGLD